MATSNHTWLHITLQDRLVPSINQSSNIIHHSKLPLQFIALFFCEVMLHNFCPRCMSCSSEISCLSSSVTVFFVHPGALRFSRWCFHHICPFNMSLVSSFPSSIMFLHLRIPRVWETNRFCVSNIVILSLMSLHPTEMVRWSSLYFWCTCDHFQILILYE